jgi:hypothetical protein
MVIASCSSAGTFSNQTELESITTVISKVTKSQTPSLHADSLPRSEAVDRGIVYSN